MESVAAATVPLRLQEMWRQADGLHKPFGLVFASAHVLGTACALTGETACHRIIGYPHRVLWTSVGYAEVDVSSFAQSASSRRVRRVAGFAAP